MLRSLGAHNPQWHIGKEYPIRLLTGRFGTPTISNESNHKFYLHVPVGPADIRHSPICYRQFLTLLCLVEEEDANNIEKEKICGEEKSDDGIITS